jgi:tyrosine-protein phosphatase YwqE
MQAQGLQPVFAHPERYSYLQSDFGLLTKIYEKGVKLQLNLNSFNGYYGKAAKDLANKIADKGWVSFVGTDCHKIGHLQQLHKTFEQSSSFQKLSLDSILNNTL